MGDSLLMRQPYGAAISDGVFAVTDAVSDAAQLALGWANSPGLGYDGAASLSEFWCHKPDS